MIASAAAAVEKDVFFFFFPVPGFKCWGYDGIFSLNDNLITYLKCHKSTYMYNIYIYMCVCVRVCVSYIL